MKDTLEGRAVAVLVAHGSDGASIAAVKKAVTAAGAKVRMVAPNIGALTLDDGSVLNIDAQLAGTPSVMFEAIAIILSAEAAALLGKDGAAIDFVRDAFAHLKAITIDPGGAALLKKSGVMPDAGVIGIDLPERLIAAAKTRQWEREARVRTLA